MSKKAAARMPLPGAPAKPLSRSLSRPVSRPVSRPLSRPLSEPGRRAPTYRRMALRPHPDGWALQVDDVADAAWVVPTKRSALASAEDAAAFHRCRLDVHTRSGRVQRTLRFDRAG